MYHWSSLEILSKFATSAVNASTSSSSRCLTRAYNICKKSKQINKQTVDHEWSSKNKKFKSTYLVGSNKDS